MGRPAMDIPAYDLLQDPFFRRRRSPIGATITVEDVPSYSFVSSVEDVPLYSFVSSVNVCEHCGYQFRDEDDALFHPPHCIKNPANKCGCCGYRFRDADDAAGHLVVCAKRTCGYLPSQRSMAESPERPAMDIPAYDLLQDPFFRRRRSPIGATITVEDVPSYSFVSSVEDVPLYSFVSSVNVCEYCGYQFRDEDDALFHPQQCLKNPKNVCEYCGYRFKDEVETIDHFIVCSRKSLASTFHSSPKKCSPFDERKSIKGINLTLGDACYEREYRHQINAD